MNFLKLNSVPPVEADAPLPPTLDASKTTTSAPVRGFEEGAEEEDDFLAFLGFDGAGGVEYEFSEEEVMRARKSRSWSGVLGDSVDEVKGAFLFFDEVDVEVVEAVRVEEMVLGRIMVLTSFFFLRGAGAAEARAAACFVRTRSIVP